MNDPLFTVLLLSHRKPALVRQAIDSVLTQTFADFELLVIDSGELLNDLAQYHIPPKIRVLPTNETEELRGSCHIVSWVLNRFIPQARGKFITILCDDDYLLPDFLSTFEAFIELGAECYWTGIEVHQCDGSGKFIRKIRDMLAVNPPYIGVCGSPMMCYSKRAAIEFPWIEDKSLDAVDGVLMSRLHAKYPFKAVPGIHAVHRRTPLSVYCGDGSN